MALRSTGAAEVDLDAGEPDAEGYLIEMCALGGSEPDLGYQSREGTFSQTLDGKGRPTKHEEEAQCEPADDALDTEEVLQLRRLLHPSHLATPVEAGQAGVHDGIHYQGTTSAAQEAQEEGKDSVSAKVKSLEEGSQDVKDRVTAPGCWKNIGVLQKIIVILLVLLLVPICVLAWKFAHTEIPCSEEWTLYDGQCYYFSSEAKYWELAKKFCASHGARLAIIKDKQSLKTIDRFKGNEDYWIGLRKQKGSTWFWEDGSPFHNDTIAMENDGARLDCAYLNTKKIGVLECNTLRHWICVKERN